jgi:hypothetical protein
MKLLALFVAVMATLCFASTAILVEAILQLETRATRIEDAPRHTHPHIVNADTVTWCEQIGRCVQINEDEALIVLDGEVE